MGDYRIISSDNHIVEPPDLWTERLPADLKERGPVVHNTPDGPFWVIDGMTHFNIFAMGAQPGVRLEDGGELNQVEEWGDVRPGAYIGEEAVKDMDIDGLDVGLVYPSLTIFLYPFVEDSNLLTAIDRSYNDFAAEFCQANPRRLKGVAVINIDDVEDGVEEIKRCVKKGFVGATIPEYMAAKSYRSRDYDPLWECAQDLGIPLTFHISTARVQAGRGWDRDMLDPFDFANFLLHNADFWVRVSLTEVILSGVFERFPNLKIGVAEHELSWIPYWLERLNFSYNDRPAGRDGYRIPGDLLPSDVFHTNCFADFQEDALGIQNRDIIGVDNILWGSDYPHSEGTWPKSREFIETTLADCTDEERAKLVGGNTARIYGI